jgi:hypothetical protein
MPAQNVWPVHLGHELFLPHRYRVYLFGRQSDGKHRLTADPPEFILIFFDFNGAL